MTAKQRLYEGFTSKSFKNVVIFRKFSYDIVSYAPHFLPVKIFFPKYSFNKLYIELPQNVTCTDE